MHVNHFPKNEKIGFLRKTTLVDFPEHVACAVFLMGCNLRCPYCYNKDLVLLNQNSPKDDFSTLEEVIKHLELRKNVLSVCSYYHTDVGKISLWDNKKNGFFRDPSLRTRISLSFSSEAKNPEIRVLHSRMTSAGSS